jgi:hypothetical protein
MIQPLKASSDHTGLYGGAPEPSTTRAASIHNPSATNRLRLLDLSQQPQPQCRHPGTPRPSAKTGQMAPAAAQLRNRERMQRDFGGEAVQMRRVLAAAEQAVSAFGAHKHSPPAPPLHLSHRVLSLIPLQTIKQNGPHHEAGCRPQGRYFPSQHGLCARWEVRCRARRDRCKWSETGQLAAAAADGEGPARAVLRSRPTGLSSPVFASRSSLPKGHI